MRPPRLLLCLTVLTAGTAPAASRADEFVHRNGSSFQLCNQTFRFVGFNVRGICHFGRGDILPFSSTSDIAVNLDYCAAAKARVIRVFCAYNGIGQTATGDRLQVVLDACQTRGIKVLVCLTDDYLSGFFPQGDNGYYTVGGCCGLTLLNHTFFQSGYQNNYLPQAVYLADRFRDHPAVFAWELGNEIRDTSSSATFVAFCLDVAAQIRAADPNHMIGAGLIDADNAGLSAAQALQLYGAMDFVGSHAYHGSDAENDTGIAAQLNKPYLIGEAGFAGSNRVAASDADITKWVGRGVDGYLQWGLMATNYDNGDGDTFVGVDPVFHADDFFDYGVLFNAWSTSFEQPASLVVSPTAIERTVQTGQNASPDAFTVAAGGFGSHAFSVSESLSWLSVAPTGGTATCAGSFIAVQYATSTLPPGTHVGNVNVTASGLAGSPQTVQVTVIVEGAPADVDGDGDVDLEDHGLFQACLTGPGEPQNLSSCQAARLDADADVDSDDLTLFLGCMSGANVPSDPACLP